MLSSIQGTANSHFELLDLVEWANSKVWTMAKNIKLYNKPYLHMKGTTFRNNMHCALDFSCNLFAILNHL